MNKHHQKHKYCLLAYFDVNEDPPERRGYRLRDRIRCEIFPSDTSTDDMLLLQNFMEQEFYPITEIVMTKYEMKQGLKCFGKRGVIAIEK